MSQSARSRVLSDAGVTRLAAGGSRDAFAAIFERYNQDLYRYCAALLGSSEDAQDAVQNTMVKVLRALPGEQRDVKLKPWLYRIAHNEAIDMIRARKRTEPIEIEAIVGQAGPAEEVDARDRLQQLVSDIAELPSRQRGALVMREMGGLSYDQIGDALQTSPAVARQTIYEARLNLRQMSEGREMPCQEVMRALSDEDGRVLRRRDIRAHLLRCESCQAFRSDIEERRREFAALAPLPAAAAAGILQGLLGGAAGGSGAAAGAAGAGAGKALVGSAAIKSAAAVCVVAAVGVFAADDSGLIHLGERGGGGDPPAGAAARSAPGNGNPAVTPTGQRLSGGAINAAEAQRAARQRGLRRASVATPAQPRPGSPVASNPPAEHPAEQVLPESNGRHLGWSKGASHKGNPSKPDHPAKGKKASSATPPGQLKSPGQAKHGGSPKSAGGKPPEAPSTQPTHPPHPDQSQAPKAPDAEASPEATAPSGTAESGHSQHGKTK